jgi:undecaprenyl-diphosphatase
LIACVVFPLLALLFYHTPQGFELVGFIIGFTLGYFLEDTYLDYQERTSFLPSLYKTLSGIASLLIWILLCLPLIRLSSVFNLPVFCFAGVWTSFGAPYVFRRFGWEANFDCLK